MGNTKNKKVPKKRSASNTSNCKTSSDQKENVPKNEKSRRIKPGPIEGIAMSKQLLSKKNNVRTQRRSSSKPERIYANGKPLPSLAELEKMFEDSDDDQPLKKPTQKPTYITSTPEKQIPKRNSEKNLLSPTTINKITERIMGSIQKQNLPDPSEVIEATSLICEKTPPPPPVVAPKKRKKPDVPYIVGCKDRPQVIKKPNTNFCKGYDDYGVEVTNDPEENTVTKRAKKSRIPNYTKSIFNSHSNEIAERLIKDDAGGLSDASTDSNKTIEYNPLLFQHWRPHSFSPLPSTSTDTETFRKNDELFNESFKEINIHKESKITEDDLPVIELTPPTKKEHDFSITEEPTPKNKDDVVITDILILEKQDTLNKNLLSPKKGDEILITKNSTLAENEDDVEIIDIAYDTIEIEDMGERTVGKQHTNNTTDTNIIEIIESEQSEVIKPKEETIIHKITDDEDCMIVPSSQTIKNHNNFNNNKPIVIDDEYSTINTQFDSFNSEPVDISDIDDIIAENKSILDKWKNFGAKELHKGVTVVDVTTSEEDDSAPLITITSNTRGQTPSTSGCTLQTDVTPNLTCQIISTPCNTPQTTVTTSSDKRQQTAIDRSVTFQRILNEFFKCRHDKTHGVSSEAQDYGLQIAELLSKMESNRTNRTISQSINNTTPVFAHATPVSTNPNPASNKAFRNAGNRRLIEVTSLPNPVTQQTSTAKSAPPPVPSRNIGDCPICLDPLHSSNGIASTICGHVFCLKCIQASVKTNGKKCPTCRKALKGAGGGYHQLYL